MSGWDAPTGGWDSGEEPEGSTPDDQGYQQARSAGSHRAARGEGIPRSGRRSLPGYDQAQDYEPSVFRRTIPPPSQGAGGYGQGASGAYPPHGSPDPGPAAWSGADDQGYPAQAFGQQQPADAGYGQPGTDQDYGTQAFARPGYDQPGYDQPGYESPGRGQPGYGQGAQGYQTEAYPQQGFEPPGYAQGGYPDQGYGPSGYDQNGYGQAPGGPGAGYQQDGHGQGAYDGFSQNGAQGTYAQDGYGQPGYGQGGYGADAYRQDSYGQDAYGQPGFDQPGGQAYGGDDLSAVGLAPRPAQPRSGPSRQAQRSPQRLSGIRMILYLVAAVVGVILIVFLVVRLTKTGTSSTGGTPAPTTSSTAAATTSGFVVIKAPSVGSFPLNTAATSDFSQYAQKVVVPEAQQIKARGAGNPGQQVVAMYPLGTVTNVNSSNFRAIGFVGYDGTFKPSAVIRYMQTQLVSARRVSAGPHGGEMICGYNTSEGTNASECVWATTTTFGQVEFVKGQKLVKYPGASTVALEVRKAVEVKAG